MMNTFLNAAYKYDAYTENGAISHSTSGDALLDYFSKAGTYRNRELQDVFADLSLMWAQSPKIALQIIFYNRLITRKISGDLGTEKVQMGQGNKSEFRLALKWLAKNHRSVLNKNLWLVPFVGCWKDLWHTDLIHDLDRNIVFDLIRTAMRKRDQADLIAKYLPRIRSKSNTHNVRHLELNEWAHAFIKYLGWTPKQYRKFKSSGNAHEFQRKMSQDGWEDLDFNTIPGKALFQMVNHHGLDGLTTLQRHGLEEGYLDWIMDQPTAKFTGYVYELMNAVSYNSTLAQSYTVDKQFDGLIELAQRDKKIQENVWCALDTSGSMLAPVANTNAYNICISLGIYFSTLNSGSFKDHVIMFDSKSRIKQLKGSFTDKVHQIRSTKTAWGSTNFQSVIDEIVRIRKKNPHIPISDFPSTLVVVSDMQFNPVNGNATSNYEAAMFKLKQVGLPKIRIVWWWVTGRAQDFPSTIDDKGVIMIGGFDGAILSLLLGEEQKSSGSKKVTEKLTPLDNMLKALNQEILQNVKL
ncbi:MAG: DUF2828 family protein [Flavobacteriales bacterium]|nr:DUF2828 family protein [Flavobacteriales bacterium]